MHIYEPFAIWYNINYNCYMVRITLPRRRHRSRRALNVAFTRSRRALNAPYNGRALNVAYDLDPTLSITWAKKCKKLISLTAMAELKVKRRVRSCVTLKF